VPASKTGIEAFAVIREAMEHKKMMAIGLGQLGMRHLRHAAHFLRGAQGGEDEALVLDLDRADPLARAHYQPADGHHLLVLHGLADHGEGLDAGLARRHEMVWPLPIEPVDRAARHELLDVDDPRRFELHSLEVFLVEQDVFALGNLEALHEVAPRHFLAGSRVDRLHPDAVVGLGIDEIEADRLRLAHGGIERDRAGHEGQAQMSFPGRPDSHDDPRRLSSGRFAKDSTSHWRGRCRRRVFSSHGGSFLFRSPMIGGSRRCRQATRRPR
jgi:hypothetical protein